MVAVRISPSNQRMTMIGTVAVAGWVKVREGRIKLLIAHLTMVIATIAKPMFRAACSCSNNTAMQNAGKASAGDLIAEAFGWITAAARISRLFANSEPFRKGGAICSTFFYFTMIPA
jgi:hypothetical protein